MLVTVQQVKTELRIDGNHDDVRLAGIIEEALFELQRFKDRTIVAAVTDPETQVALSPLDRRAVYLYVAIQYDGRQDLADAYAAYIEKVRDGK
jgi:undecaprenyl pyrophosphate synthase